MGSGKADAPRRAAVELRALPAGRTRPTAGSASARRKRTDENPCIPPGRRPVLRAPGEVQFGVRPGGSIVRGVSEVELRALSRLDGSVSLSSSYRLAGEAGIPVGRWRALLDLVDRLGVLEWRPSGGRTSQPALTTPTVVLDGPGPLVDDVCALLRRGGSDAVVEQARPLAATPATSPDATPVARPALAVIIGPMALDPRSGDGWLRRGVPHLPVVAEDTRATVGPLVDPSLTGPCLWCLDLHRTDRDGAWPAVLAQLCGAPGDVVPHDASAATDPALAHLLAGCVALFTTRLLGGGDIPSGVAVEVSLPWPRMDHRRWTIHPRCPRRHRSPGRGAA